MSRAMETLVRVSENPYLRVPQHVVWDAVRSLAADGRKIEALRLLRGAYFTDEEGWASLADALAIYGLIVSSSCSMDIPGLVKAFECDTQ